MPTKIGFTVVSSTGEDENYRATDLNYHGPTVKGWRSAQWCHYPQDITLQLHTPTILHRIQILAHQYLIAHKIEIWTCEDLEYDPAVSPSGLQCFQYLGFITLSDNEGTGFKSRELKSVTTPPTPARYVKLRLFENHVNQRNIYNQVGLVAVSVLGDSTHLQQVYGDDLNNNGHYDSLPASDVNLISNPQYTSPYDDLAFEMYVDKDVARIMRLMESKKHQAVLEERFEYARKLKSALQQLREAGETLGRYEQEKRQAINLEDYDKAKQKKNQIEKYRDQVYTTLQVEQLLELERPHEENDNNAASVNIKHPKEETEDVEDGEEVEENDQDYEGSCDSPVEEDTHSPHHSYVGHPTGAPPSPRSNEPRVTWSPQRPKNERSKRSARPQRRTSLSDYPSLAPSLNQLTHSFSHSSFPTSSSTHHLRQTPSENVMPQFQCYTPYTYHPALNICSQTASVDNMYKSLPPIRLQEPFYLAPEQEPGVGLRVEPLVEAPAERARSPTHSNASRSPTNNNATRPTVLRGSVRRRSKSNAVPSRNSYEAYEERMLPALRHPQVQGNDVVRECQLPVDQSRKSKLNERERKQAALPVSVFGIELVEKFYSKHFADKEEGLRLLQESMKSHMNEPKASEIGTSITLPFSANKMARAAIFLLHRALRDKVYSVYSAAADAIRFFFHEFVPGRVAISEVARSVEKLLPELIAKSGDVTPRIHNMAAHTLLSMVDCKQVRDLHIIPVHLSRPLSSSVHPRLALSRLEMVEQLILNHGISTEKQSGLTCRTLAEFGSSGLHHPAEAVRKVSERILVQVYKVNPRIVRKQLPPDDDVTRRNLLYRQLFQEFDLMDLQKRRDQQAKENHNQQVTAAVNFPSDPKPSISCNSGSKESVPVTQVATTKSTGDQSGQTIVSQIPKRTVNQQTSPMTPMMPTGFEIPGKDENENQLRIVTPSKNTVQSIGAAQKIVTAVTNTTETLLRRRNMSRISEESNDAEVTVEKETTHPIHSFSNLVDSVHVTENRLSFAQKSAQHLKSIKYIFPTSYIGTSSKSQETVDKSNISSAFNKNSELKTGRIKHSSGCYSGIPIPKNGFNGKNKPVFSALMSAHRFANIKPPASKVKESTRVLESLTNTDMTMAVYIPSSEISVLTQEPSQSVQDISVDTSSSASVITPPSEGDTMVSGPETEQEGQTYKTCIFCFAKENWFTEESLNMHYWKNCPMLTRCSKCKEVVEISGLIQHRLDDCEHRKSFIKCERCQEAILQEEWNDHDRTSCKFGVSRLRCPFCHENLTTESDWREHLMGDKICSNHPRKSTH